MHLGGTTLPGGLVVTMDGRAGSELVELIGPDEAIPVHYDDHGVFKSPLSDFGAEMGRRGLGHLVPPVDRGEPVELARRVQDRRHAAEPKVAPVGDRAYRWAAGPLRIRSMPRAPSPPMPGALIN